MKVTIAVSIVFLIFSSILNAHHARAAVYDPSVRETISGAFVTLRLVNPHTRLYIDVTNDKGETERWMVEGPGKLSLARRGWNDNMFTPGETITVIGSRSITGNKSIWLERIRRSDGTEYLDPRIADQLIIERERRRRIPPASQ